DSDRLAFGREANRRRNAVVLERPNGDWAYTIARHFFYDVFDQIRLEALSTSGYVPLAHGVTKIRREEHYHLLHMRLWFTRLGSAGGEAEARMRRAIRDLWPDIGGLFSLGMWSARWWNSASSPSEPLNCKGGGSGRCAPPLRRQNSLGRAPRLSPQRTGERENTPPIWIACWIR